MGIYLNPGNTLFKKALEREIYVDKSALIEKLWNNSVNFNQYICFSRPRRFGKSTDANMLTAFFSRDCNSKDLFDKLYISGWNGYEANLNSHYVIHLDMQRFISRNHNIEEMISNIYDEVGDELKITFDVTETHGHLDLLLNKCFFKSNSGFIFIIDEWDCILRDYKDDKKTQQRYLDYLRMLFKEQPYVKMVYMTGILPIKKYGTHSALNMFDEISMIDAGEYSSFMGFTEMEVQQLCEKYNTDYEHMKFWYDGYHMRDGISTYSSSSVTSAIARKTFSNYWSQTETFDALRAYIDLNYDGLKDTVIKLLACEEQYVNVRTFQNGMDSFAVKDDVLTLLIHLGYLGYNFHEQTVYIPNQEVKDTFIDSVSISNWDVVANVFQNARDLLNATWNKDSERVAAYIEKSHYENSVFQYNDENALSYTVSLAYITARQYYTIVRELPTGKGYADMVFIPRKGVDRPAMVVELKWNQEANSGIRQIVNKKYYLGLEEYLDHLLLVCITYEKDTKKHSCMIEKYQDLSLDSFNFL